MIPRRERIAHGIRKDQYGYRVTVHVRPLPQKEKRFPFDTPLRAMKNWQEETRVAMRALAPRYRHGTFTDDAQRYLARVKPNHIDDRAYRQRVREIEAWLPLFGNRVRLTITADEYTRQLEAWREKRSAQTCNLRRGALSHLYRTLDGKSAANIVRDVVRFQTPDPTPKALPLDVIDAVLDQLPDGARCKTRARLRLMRWTGMRPSQMFRLKLSDFQLRAPGPHVIVPRGKKGKVVRLPFVGRQALNAARAFVEVCATDTVKAGEPFGAWSQTSANRLLKNACAAAGVERFNLYRIKHSVGSRLRQVMDLADVQHVYGHMNSTTTAIYAPPLDEKIVQGFRHLTVRKQRRAS